jgi:hypothetical protein
MPREKTFRQKRKSLISSAAEFQPCKEVHLSASCYTSRRSQRADEVGMALSLKCRLQNDVNRAERERYGSTETFD